MQDTVLSSFWSPVGPLGTFITKVVANKGSTFSGMKTLQNRHFLRGRREPRACAAGVGKGVVSTGPSPTAGTRGAGDKRGDDWLARCVCVLCAHESTRWVVACSPPLPVASPVVCVGRPGAGTG